MPGESSEKEEEEGKARFGSGVCEEGTGRRRPPVAALYFCDCSVAQTVLRDVYPKSMDFGFF